MVRITYACPTCRVPVRLDGIESATALACPACGAAVPVPPGALAWSGPDGSPAAAGDGVPTLRRCLVCPGSELFARKDFPQRLGVAIVVIGFAASCLTWAWRLLVPTFAILFGTALVDVVLYLLMPECLTCYRCGARYGGVGGPHGGFDLETHEKHRQRRSRLGGGVPPASGPP